VDRQDPQSSESDGDPIGDFQPVALAFHKVESAHKDCQNSARDGHDDNQLEKPGRLDPQRQRCQQFNITAAHHF